MEAGLEEYIESHISQEPSYLREIDRKSNLYHINGRMCSGHIQGRLLKMIASMIRPGKVLELGTFTGYSALCIAEALDEDSQIHTIEFDDELEEEIRKNFEYTPDGKKITLHIGDALQVMEKWDPETFDLVIIDADKRQYPQYLKKSLELLRKGGFILADNTLWDGHVVEEGKHSSQTRGIIEFNRMAAELPGLEVAIIPVRDGITLIRKT